MRMELLPSGEKTVPLLGLKERTTFEDACELDGSVYVKDGLTTFFDRDEEDGETLLFLCLL